MSVFIYSICATYSFSFNLSYLQRVILSKANGSDNIFFDASTSLKRSEQSIECSVDATTCVRPTHAIYSVQYGRYLTPTEYLSVQGMWKKDSENVEAWDAMVADEKLAQSLAGNGFSATVCQCVFLTSLVACDAFRHFELSSPQTHKRPRLEELSPVFPASFNPGLDSAMADQDHSPAASPVEHAQSSGTSEPPACRDVQVIADSGDLPVPTRRLRKKTTLVTTTLEKKKKKNKHTGRGKGGKGNNQAGGKKKQATIWEKEQIMKTYMDAVNKGVKRPTSKVKDMPGYFTGCVFPCKWGDARVKNHWELLCSTAPKLMKRHKDLPNSVRRMLNMDTMKHSVHKPSETSQLHLPLPLQTVIEDMIMERICIGEEVSMHYAKDALAFGCEIWNQVVGSMRACIREKMLGMLRDQDAELAALDADKVDEKLDAMMKTAEGLLQPIQIAQTDAALLTLGIHSILYHTYRYMNVNVHVILEILGCSKCGLL